MPVFCVIIHYRVFYGGEDLKKAALALKIALSVVLVTVMLIMISADVLFFTPSIPDIPSEDKSYDPDIPNRPSDEENDRPHHPEEDIPNWSITPTVVKNTLVGTDGDILCETRYTYPSVKANDLGDVSAFSAALAQMSNEIKNYVSKRSETYKTGSSRDFSVPPQITGYYTVNRFSVEFFSITFVFSEISPDGNVGITRFNYNIDILLDSASVTIDAIMNDPTNVILDAISDLDGSEDLALFPNHEKLIASLSGDVWYVGADSIVFTFAPGTIAPVSSGEIKVSIGGSKLTDSLSEYGKILLNVS